MRLVVADTGPLNYLVLIGAGDLLPKLFTTVMVPEAVCAELRHPRTPASVRAWAMQPPVWIDVRPVPAALAMIQHLAPSTSGNGRRWCSRASLMPIWF